MARLPRNFIQSEVTLFTQLATTLFLAREV